LSARTQDEGSRTRRTWLSALLAIAEELAQGLAACGLLSPHTVACIRFVPAGLVAHSRHQGCAIETKRFGWFGESKFKRIGGGSSEVATRLGVRRLAGNRADAALVRRELDVRCSAFGGGYFARNESGVCPFPSPTALQDASRAWSWLVPHWYGDWKRTRGCPWARSPNSV